MKRWLAAVAILGAAWSATPAEAHLVEVSTSMAVADARDEAGLRQAVMAAADRVLRDAIDFTPTLIVLTRLTVVGDRLYLGFLLADEAGAREFEGFHAPGSPTGAEI